MSLMSIFLFLVIVLCLSIPSALQVKQKGHLSAQELSKLVQGLSLMLAMERFVIHGPFFLPMHFYHFSRLLLSERAGKLCRDDTVEGLRFYPNRFLEPS